VKIGIKDLDGESKTYTFLCAVYEYLRLDEKSSFLKSIAITIVPRVLSIPLVSNTFTGDLRFFFYRYRTP